MTKLGSTILSQPQLKTKYYNKINRKKKKKFNPRNFQGPGIWLWTRMVIHEQTLRNRSNILLYLLEPLPFIVIGTGLFSWPKDNISCILSGHCEFNLRAKSSTSLHRKDATYCSQKSKPQSALTTGICNIHHSVTVKQNGGPKK